MNKIISLLLLVALFPLPYSYYQLLRIFVTLGGLLYAFKFYESDLKEKAVFAFAGIAHPKKFKTTLENLQAKVIKFVEFSNHKSFKVKILKNIIASAEENHAIVVTTEKDLMRIPKNLQKKIHALKIYLELDDQNLLIKKLKTALLSD